MLAWSFDAVSFPLLCDKLAADDKELRTIIMQYGYPPMWSRPASFATLIHIILEQQVSLASAKAAYGKLEERLGIITPSAVLLLTDEEMKACYFSRQKTVYARELAHALVSEKIVLEELASLPDEEVRSLLKTVKGIGDWTVDIYLQFALQRADLFPTGDLAMMNAFRDIKQLPRTAGKEQVLALAEKWRPYRSIATFLLWHYYIQKRGIRI